MNASTTSSNERIRLGLVVGRNETWSFIRDLYNDWQHHYQVDVFAERTTSFPFFKERLNRRRLTQDLSEFLDGHDVVFFEWASELLALSSRLPRRARIVTRLHRYEMYEWVDRINWDFVDDIILVSEAKRGEFLGRFPNQADKCHVIPEAIDLSKFPFRPRSFNGTLGILCHITPRKRVYELILTFFNLVKQYPRLRLHIGGGHQTRYADYYFALTDVVRRLGLGDCVVFDGPVTDTPAWYEKIDIYISNSFSEGLQVSPMEAMASGCFTISHWWAGADELLPEENLYFTDAELQQRLLAYCQLSETEKQSQLAAMRRIVEEKFDVQKTAPLIRAVVEGEPYAR